MARRTYFHIELPASHKLFFSKKFYLQYVLGVCHRALVLCFVCQANLNVLNAFFKIRETSSVFDYGRNSYQT